MATMPETDSRVSQAVLKRKAVDFDRIKAVSDSTVLWIVPHIARYFATAECRQINANEAEAALPGCASER